MNHEPQSIGMTTPWPGVLALSVADAVPEVDILVTATGCPFESKYAGAPWIRGAMGRWAVCGKTAEVGVVWGLLLLRAGAAEPALGGDLSWLTLDRPARREILSARSASRLPWEACCWWPG